MNAALRTKLIAGLLLVAITGGSIAAVVATTAPEQDSTPYGIRSGLYPGYFEALEKYLGGTVMDEYGQLSVQNIGAGMCRGAESGYSDSQILSTYSESLGGMGYQTARRLYAITLAYGICTVD